MLKYGRNYDNIEGSVGVIRTIKGNRLINNPLLDANSKLIMTINNSYDNSILLGYYNTNPTLHSIWRLNADETYTLVVKSPYLNFQLTNKIHNGFVIFNGNQQIVYFTDGYFLSYINQLIGVPNYNAPHNFILEKMILFTQSGGTDPDGYSVVDQKTLDWVKSPQNLAPTWTYETLATASNFILGKMMQFSVQYIMDDRSKTRYSPISKLNILSNYYMNGTPYLLEFNQNNIARVLVNTGHNTVKKINVAYRYGNNGSFRLFKTLDKDELTLPDNTLTAVDFDGTIQGFPISDFEASYDQVPQIAGSCEFMTLPSEAALANLIDGYPRVDLAGQVTLTPEQIEFGDVNGLLPRINVTYNAFVNLNFGVKWRWQEGDLFIIQWHSATGPQQYLYEVPAITGATEADKIDNLITDMGTALTTAGYTVVVSLPFNSLAIDGNITSPDNNGTLQVFRQTIATKTHKSGCWYKVYFQYEDRANRDGSALTVPTEMEVYIPFPTEVTLANPRRPYYNRIKIAIQNDFLPPDWADTLRIGMQPMRSIKDFQWRTIFTIHTYGEEGQAFLLSLEKFYEEYYDGMNINHIPAAGDRIRFIRNPNNQDYDFSYQAEYYAGPPVEVIVLDYLPSGGSGGREGIVVSWFDWQSMFGYQYLTSGQNNYSGPLIEIYTPRDQTDSPVVWNTGVDFPILNPHTANRRHSGDVDQVVGVTDCEILLEGDVYIRLREYEGPYGEEGWTTPFNPDNEHYVVGCEDPHYNDSYPSADWSKGRLMLENEFAARKELIDSIAHTKKFQKDTQVNGLSTMEFQDRRPLSGNNGAITWIGMSGDVLVVLQERKNTSIYINKSLSSAGDSPVVINTDLTFGSINPHDENYGSVDPGSVTVYDRNVFFYDRNNAIWVKSTIGGQFEITSGNYKYSKRTSQISQELLSLQGTTSQIITSAYDKNNEEYRFFGKGTSVGANNSINTAFSTIKSRWEYETDEVVHWAWQFGDRFYTSDETGQVYKMNEGAILTFFGVVKTFQVDFVFNESPLDIKRLYNLLLRIEKSKLAGTFTMPVIQTEENESYGTMLSHLIASDFKPQQGAYVAAYKRDESDPNYTDALQALLVGRELQGYAFLHRLVYSSAFLLKLSSAQFNYAKQPPLGTT